MSVATTRTCRTCPAVISEHGASGQCRPCQQRSALLREVIREPDSPTQPTGPRSCKTDGHHACGHFVTIYRHAKRLMEESLVCPICGEEADDDEDATWMDIVHKTGCALIVIVNADPAGRPETAEEDG